MNDFVIKSKNVLYFPSTLGLSGRCFQKRHIYFNNLVHKKLEGTEDVIDEDYMRANKLKKAQHKFMNDIDNSLGAKNFDNYLIGALYTGKS